MRRVLTLIGLASVGLSAIAYSTIPTIAGAQSSRETMRSFASERELARFLRRVQQENTRYGYGGYPAPPPPPPPPAPSAPGAAPAASDAAESSMVAVVVTGTLVSSPSITNNQTANVDEGGIVKTHGRHLVVLRRGRLFTIDTSGGSLRAVDAVNAFPPSDRGGEDAWYDEMLVSNDLVVVIGFNYARAGTEINRFRISDAGQLTYLDTHHLRSDDYYSSRNYASRLIGTRLVVYAPLNFSYDEESGLGESLPGLRRWSTGGPQAGFERLATPRRIFAADMLLNSRNANVDTTHSVTSCDLAAPRFNCSATVVLGSESRNFYVAQDAVYVWTGDAFRDDYDRDEEDYRSILYRIPLNAGAPQAVGVWGSPIDQFSFRADRDQLNVLVRNDDGGESMWRAETGEGDLALLRLPLRHFGNGSRMAPSRLYQDLPGGDRLNSIENRFVGGHLLYSGYPNRRGASHGNRAPIIAVTLANGQTTAMETPLEVSRIDIMGRDAMVIGTNERDGLVFQTVDLQRRPALADSYTLPAAREGENRSHAYYFRSDSEDGTSGILGLPVARDIDHPNARFLGSGSAIFFLNRRNRALSPAGQLDADERGAVADNCLASCVDWYGNARPIFYGDRIFALMGYELVEGRVEAGRIGEVRRLNFAPNPAEARR